MGEHKTTRIIEFDCRHTRVFPDPAPKVGDTLWCLRCNKDVRVVRGTNEYRIRCQNCIYSRPFGTARLNAEIAAAKHRMSHTEHVVHLYNGTEFLRRFPDRDQDRNQTVIPMTSDRDSEVPF